MLHAYSFFESGNLAVALPRPSYRLVQGIDCYHRASNAIYARQLDDERKEREQKRGAL